MKKKTISIKNWDEFQHYSKRNPPWIKFYHSLLDDYFYGCLQDDSKLLLVSLYLLASKTNNNIPYDLKWIQTKAMLSKKVNLQPLIDSGFIYLNSLDDSTTIAEGEQDAHAREEEERREEKRQIVCGEFLNVKLSEDEFKKLNKKFGKVIANKKIEDLSSYIASTGKKYRSHYATILMWSAKDIKERPRESIDQPKPWVTPDWMKQLPDIGKKIG